VEKEVEMEKRQIKRKRRKEINSSDESRPREYDGQDPKRRAVYILGILLSQRVKCAT